MKYNAQNIGEFIAELKSKLELAMPTILREVEVYEQAVAKGTQQKNPKPSPQFNA